MALVNGMINGAKAGFKGAAQEGARATRGARGMNIGGSINNLVGGTASNMNRVKGTASWMGNTFRNSFDDQSAMGMIKGVGKHALRGGVAGGVVGGVTESAQGGSFWSGAKSGAWNGAVGWSAYRSLGRATGAASRNPLSSQGPIGSAANMWSATSGNAEVSKQAIALLNQKQRAGLAKRTMNTR